MEAECPMCVRMVGRKMGILLNAMLEKKNMRAVR